MTITRSQVADLHEGDFVEFRIDDWPERHAIRATLKVNDLGALVVPIPGDDLGTYWIRAPRGHVFDGEHRTLTVVSRAPRPLYVNHPRPGAAPGDVVRNADQEVDSISWIFRDRCWQGARTGVPFDRHELPGRLRLLVDGETGQVVPS